MKDMKDRECFKNWMLLLGEVYSKEISQTILRLYWKLLEQYTDQECNLAFQTHMKTSKFWPKPADLIFHIEGSKETRATLAWLQVDKAVRQIGPYENISFEDKHIHTVINVLGGWSQFQNVPSANHWNVVGRQFEKLYVSMQSEERKDGDFLPGLIELDNSRKGLVEFLPSSIYVVGLFGNIKKIKRKLICQAKSHKTAKQIGVGGALTVATDCRKEENIAEKRNVEELITKVLIKKNGNTMQE